VHTLSPAIIEQDDRVFALATPGADGQVQIIGQVAQGLADDDVLSLPAAMERPRWRLADGDLALEAGVAPPGPTELARDGLVVRHHPYGHALFGAAVAAGVDCRGGFLFAAGDPRREAWAGVW